VKLWGWAKEEKLNSERLNDILFLVPGHRREFSTWGNALKCGRVDLIQKLWVWAKELQLSRDELKNILLQPLNWDEEIFLTRIRLFDWYEEQRNLNIRRTALLESLWGLGKEMQLNTEEVFKFLSGHFYNTAVNGDTVTLERLWLWAGEEQLAAHEVKRRLLLHQNDEKNIWHFAAEISHIKVLEGNLDGSHEVKINSIGERCWPRRYKNECLLAEINEWTLAIEKLLDWAKEVQLNRDELRNKLLLDKEKEGRRTWFLVAYSGKVRLLQELWDLARRKGNTKEINSKLLLARNEFGETVLHMAVAGGSAVVLEKMWAFVKEAQIKVDVLKNKLLLAKDIFGYTAWHGAAERGNFVALDILWSWAKETELNPDELLLDQNERGETAFHIAVDGNHVDVLKKLWAWAEETQPKSKELKNKLLLAKDKYGCSAWHLAAQRGNSKALEILWSWAKEAELNLDELLLDQNKRGQTAFHIAVYEKYVSCNHVEVLQKMWAWAEEAQPNSNELKINCF